MRPSLLCNRVVRISACGSVLVLAASVSVVAASPPAEAIVQDVSLDNYIHYHQDLLYTYMGDNRGFGAEHNLARDNIFDELSAQPNLVVELDPFNYNSNTYHNVVATLTGTDVPEDIYVVGAHFDSVNNPGADDNATGTAIVMEVARVLCRYRSPATIKFCAFDREEQGLRGSRAFVADHVGQNIVMAVTADMVGHDSGPYGMDIFGSSLSSGVISGVVDAIDAYGDGLATFLAGSATFSDHWAFESQGIPAVVAIERCFQCNPYDHTQNDAVDNPNFPDGDYLDYTMPTNLARAFVGLLVDEIGITLWHDANNDADIDMADFAELQRCYGFPATDECGAFDLNHDNTIDIDDYDSFLDALTGPTR